MAGCIWLYGRFNVITSTFVILVIHHCPSTTKCGEQQIIRHQYRLKRRGREVLYECNAIHSIVIHFRLIGHRNINRGSLYCHFVRMIRLVFNINQYHPSFNNLNLSFIHMSIFSYSRASGEVDVCYSTKVSKQAAILPLLLHAYEDQDMNAVPPAFRDSSGARR